MAKCGRNSETTRLIASLHGQEERWPSPLARELDRPARSADARNPEAHGWRRTYSPSRPRGRRLGEWVLLAGPPAPKQQHGQVRISGNELKPARGNHRQAADLAYDNGGRTVAHRVFDHREQRSVVPGFGIDHVGRGEARLSETRGVEVGPAARPEDRTPEPGRLPRGDARQEESRGGVISQRAVGRRDLVQRTRPKTAVEPIVDRRKLKGHDAVILDGRNGQGAEFGQGRVVQYEGGHER